MRKKTFAVLMAVATLMMLIPGNQATATHRVTYYTVRYACIVSPDMYGHIEGEWVVDCNGNWSGWGWMPGANCSYTDTTYGELCDHGGGGGGGGGCHPCDP